MLQRGRTSCGVSAKSPPIRALRIGMPAAMPNSSFLAILE